MPAGLTVFNDNNVIQIDDNYFNLSLSTSLNVTFSQSYERVYRASVTVPGVRVIPAVGESSIFICLQSFVINTSNNSTTFQFLSTSAGTGKILFYDVPTGVGNFGLQTFNSLGEITYDSSRPYLDVADVIDSNSVYSSNYSVISRTVFGVQTVGVVIPQFYGINYLAVYPPEFPGDIWKGERWVEALFIRCSGNVAYFKSHVIFGGSWTVGQLTPDWYHDNKTGPVLLISTNNT